MKTAYITDTHLGCRGSSVFRKYFRHFWKNIFIPDLVTNGIKEFIHGGDFFDNRTQMHLEDLTWVLNEFVPLLKQNGIHMHIIAGNHDVCYRNTNDVNSLIFPSDVATVYHDKPREITIGFQKYLMIPWMNIENQQAIEQALAECSDRANTIVVGHFEISGALMYPGSRCEHGLEPAMFKGFQEVISGHFHQQSMIGNIRYLGSAFELTWQDYNQWRGWYHYDTQTRQIKLVDNQYSLFHELKYDYDQNKLELDTPVCEDRFVRLIIEKEYNKVQLLEIQNLIKKQQPVSLQVIDKTIINTQVVTPQDDSGDEDDVKIITTIDMVKSVMKSLNCAPGLIDSMVDVFNEAEAQMAKGE